MKVWVVCVNDWPHAVFSIKKAAEGYVDFNNARNREASEKDWRTPLRRYHVHEFTIDSEA